MGKTEKKDVGLTKYSNTIKEEKSRDYALTLTLTLTLSEKEIGGEEVLYSAKRKIRNKKGSEDLELEENSDGRWAIGQALKHQDLGTGNSYEVSYDPAYVVSGIPIASILKTSIFFLISKTKGPFNQNFSSPDRGVKKKVNINAENLSPARQLISELASTGLEQPIEDALSAISDHMLDVSVERRARNEKRQKIMQQRFEKDIKKTSGTKVRFHLIFC
jgi:hypothetical protein